MICNGIPGRPCPRDNAPAVVKGMCRTCQYRMRQAVANGTILPASEANWLPAGPLLALIDPLVASAEPPAPGRPSGWLTELTGLAHGSKEYDRLDKAIKRARESGKMNVYLVDEISCKYFKAHPCFIYGEAWWELSERAYANSSEESATAA